MDADALRIRAASSLFSPPLRHAAFDVLMITPLDYFDIIATLIIPL